MGDHQEKTQRHAMKYNVVWHGVNLETKHKRIWGYLVDSTYIVFWGYHNGPVFFHKQRAGEDFIRMVMRKSKKYKPLPSLSDAHIIEEYLEWKNFVTLRGDK